MTEPLQEGFCRTRACFAGHAALMAGYRFTGRFGLQATGYNPILESESGDLVAPERVYSTDGCTPMVRSIRDFARDYFELSHWEADLLFAGSNDMGDLEDNVADFIGQRYRSQLSKDRLQQALEQVREAESQGVWDQGTWFEVVQP